MEPFVYEKKEGHYVLDKGEHSCIDLVYKDASLKNTLDIYYPKEKQDAYPMVIFIHGGAFAKGDKGRHLSGILPSLKRGYAVVAINYRLNDEVQYENMYQDVIDAFKFLFQHQRMYCLDCNHTVLWGDTHGGYLASALAIQYPKQDCIHYITIRGVISFYAPIDLYEQYKDQMDRGEYLEMNGEIVDEVTFGAKREQLLEKLKGMDLLSQIDGSECPFYLLHGLLDPNIKHTYTIRFSQALAENKVSHTLDFVKEGIHAIDFYATPKYNKPIMQFIERVIGNDC